MNIKCTIYKKNIETKLENTKSYYENTITTTLSAKSEELTTLKKKIVR